MNVSSEEKTMRIALPSRRDGAFGAYIGWPGLAGSRRCRLQEFSGWNADIRKTCDELAGKADCCRATTYSASEAGVDLSVTSGRLATRPSSLSGLTGTPVPGLRHCRRRGQAAGVPARLPSSAIACGRADGLSDSVRHGVDAAVAYRQVALRNILGEIDGLHAPCYGIWPRTTSSFQGCAKANQAALAKKPSATVYSYPGQHHAFSGIMGRNYNAAAAALANGRQRVSTSSLR